MMKKTIALLLVALFVTSLSAASLPRPAKSKYFETLGAMFLLENGEGVIYAMTYGRRRAMDQKTYGVVVFQNPEKRKEPYVVEFDIEPGVEEMVLVQSPIIPRIKNNKLYKAEFFLYEDPAHENRLNKHVQKILFSLPEGGAEQFGIELLR